MAETENAGIQNLTSEKITKPEPQVIKPDKKSMERPRLERLLLRGTLTIGTAVMLLDAACGGDKKTVDHPTPKHITPGVTVETQIPALPSQTATLEATKTTTPTETPQPTKTPEPTKTEPTKIPEAIQRHYTVEAAPGLPNVSKEAKRTIEQDTNAVQEVLDLFPQIGKFKAVLVDTGHSRLENNTIYLNRNFYSQEALKFEAAHEMIHYLDVEINGDSLSQSLSPDQIEQLRALRQKALEDPVWGSNYTLAGILDPIKSTVHPDIIEERYSQKEAAAATNIYPDSAFICGQRSVETEGPQPFRDLLPSKDLIDTFIQNNQRPAYLDIAGFLETEQVKIAQISAIDPVMKYVFQVEQQNKDNLKGLNTLWSTQIHQNAQLIGTTVGAFWRSQLNMADTILINDFLNNNVQVISLFPPEKIAEIKSLISLRIQYANQEKIAELGKTTIYAGRQTSLSPYFEKLKEFSIRN